MKAKQSAFRFSAEAPTPDHHFDAGELYPQFPAERPCLGESKWRYGRDAEDIVPRRLNESKCGLEGGAERERNRRTPRVFEQLSEHCSGDLVGFVMRRKRENTSRACQIKEFLGVFRLSLVRRGQFCSGLLRSLGLLGKIGNHLAQGLEQELLTIQIESAFVAILLGQGDGRNNDGVVQLLP